jgi:predicted CXXCH cytochrome family protein
MGVSMAEVRPATESAPASFEHAKSDRVFSVVSRDGKVWHRETQASDRAILGEYAARYAVGSGRHAKTYLCEADGFLVESPVTWYATGGWGMSPGYDTPNHFGFGRGIGLNCLYCHAGRAEEVGGSPHKMNILEAAIGCERCHGPGSLHTARHREGQAKGAPDHTIVNPARLPRNLAEAVCQQCHFHATSMVPVRGRRLEDFRPGLPMEDFRQEYVLKSDDKGMRVVGHVEQMHLSRCYTASGTMTCTTCHDPHGTPTAERRVEYYRNACLTCHAPAACKVPEPKRRADAPGDDCARCHMPKSPTDVQHVAFTHHRVGVHKKDAAAPAPVPTELELRLWQENPRLSELDKKRGAALAYRYLVAAATTPDQARACAQRSEALLSEVRAAGLPDPVVETELALARMHANQPALSLAALALSRPDVRPGDRGTALFVTGVERFRRGDLQTARSTFAELVTLRREADDWLFLAECEERLGNRANAANAAKQAGTIKTGLRKRLFPTNPP